MSKLQEQFNKHGLGNFEQQQLAEYSDDIVLYGLSQLDKQTKPITNPLKWLMAVCQNRKLTKTEIQTQKKSERDIKVAYNKKQLVDPPKPWWSKSYEDNLVMFNDWYVNLGTEYAEYYRKDKLFYSNRFMDELSRRFSNPDEVKRINEKSKSFRDAPIPQVAPTPLPPLPIKDAQISNTTNENSLGSIIGQSMNKISNTDQIRSLLDKSQDVVEINPMDYQEVEFEEIEDYNAL